MFSGAQNFVANISHAIDNSSGGRSGIDILLEASIPEATCDSGARAYAPRCFPGTRKQYIKDIIEWAIPTVNDSPLPLYWMNGAAGVGKSAIAQTSAETIMAWGQLSASYFFSINGRNNPSTFFPSIAYQLSVKFDDYREFINKRVLRDKTLVNKTMAFQFQSLIVDPLVELDRLGKGIRKRIAIIVDGLDECEGIDAQCEIIKIVATSAREGTIPLCWAFFSRPEPHIKATFSQRDVANLCYQTALPVSCDADGDVELYLRSSFDNVLRSRGLSTTPPWPSDHDLKLIVKAANGLFIYATTVYRFIAQPGWLSLDEPLHAALGIILEVGKKKSLSGAAPLSPFAELDAFYLLILRRFPERIIPSIHLLFGILTRQNYTGTMAIANILRLTKTEIHTLCAQLSAVLKFNEEDDLPEGWDLNRIVQETFNPRSTAAISMPGSVITERLGGRIGFYHRSFLEFLVQPLRSGEFCTVSPRCCRLLFENFWKVRLEYEDSYCFRGSELVFASGVSGPGFSLSYPHENEFVNHLVKVMVYCGAIYDFRNIAGRPELGVEGKEELTTTDFRKELHIEGLLFPKSRRVSYSIRGVKGQLKYVDGTRLALARSPLWEQGKQGMGSMCSLSDLSVDLKKAIEYEQELGMIQPYSRRRDLSSRLSSLFYEKSEDNVESGLYLVGRGSKAIFWFWEINYDKLYYREFRTANLEEGERIYRAERFDLWINNLVPVTVMVLGGSQEVVM